MSESAAQALLVQLIVIISISRAIAWSAKRIGQAEVVGEMVAGIVLGPSLFGALAPDTFHVVFATANVPVFNGFAQVGLVLLMFQIGLDVELGGSQARRSVLMVATSSIVLPFGLACATSTFFYSELPDPHPSQLGFTLLFAVSMSITALPVLGRIFIETGIGKTTAGMISLNAAAVNDVVGWLLLGAVTLIISGDLSAGWIVIRVLGLTALVIAQVFLVRLLLKRFLQKHLKDHVRLRHTGISVVLVLMFLSALATSHLGLHPLIGGFTFGVILRDQHDFVAEWKTRIGPLTNTFFLPIFFTSTGLRTDIGSLGSWRDVLDCGLICLVAFAGKYGGGYLGARLAGETPHVARAIGASMNTRGLMELVVLNIGYDLGVLPKTVFTQLVYMALITTLATTPLLSRHLKGLQRRPSEL
jgi:Kef-type K+ transport system membrane component KefB